MNLKLLAFPAPQKAFLLLLLFLFLAGGVFAQVNFTLTGKITDGETPLANVSVQVKGTGSGTKTNDQGMFSISVVKGQVLVFTYVGYETREMVVGNQRDIMLSLTQTEANVLDDVVVVGYGTTKKVNLTGSIATVSSKDLKGRPISN